MCLRSFLSIFLFTPLTSSNAQESVDRYGDPLPKAATARMGTIRFRQDNSVRSVAFSSEGKTVATPFGMMDARTGKTLYSFPEIGAETAQLALSPDGKQLATVMPDLTVVIWDLAQLQKQQEEANADWIWHHYIRSQKNLIELK